MFFNKLKAISYVEVLLTLVIVGVISSIAIPTLKKYSQREELGRLAQKAYLTLNEAMDMSIIDNGPSYKWETGKASFTKYIVPYLKVASTPGSYIVVTKDNMKITCTGASYSSSGSINELILTVDVNNDKGPNKSGKDIQGFILNLAESKVRPNGNDTQKLFENNWKFTNELWNK